MTQTTNPSPILIRPKTPLIVAELMGGVFIPRNAANLWAGEGLLSAYSIGFAGALILIFCKAAKSDIYHRTVCLSAAVIFRLLPNLRFHPNRATMFLETIWAWRVRHV